MYLLAVNNNPAWHIGMMGTQVARMPPNQGEGKTCLTARPMLFKVRVILYERSSFKLFK